MDTMRYQEHKKKSNLGLISFVIFVVVGGSLVFLGIMNEDEPNIVGGVTTEVQSLVDINSQTTNVENTLEDIKNISFEVTDKNVSDTSNSKIKSDITIPVVKISEEEQTKLNEKVEKKYTELFATLKEQLKDVSNSFTYKITYNSYDNVVKTKRILSLTLHQRIIDDEAGKTTTDKVETYNIDFATKEELKISDVLLTAFGKDYKVVAKNSIKNYVVQNGMMNEADYTYALSGLENFYIKDGEIHIIFNESELVDEKYGVLDIVVKND